MPRLPTIRVTGSKFISTSLPGLLLVAVAMVFSLPARTISGGELGAVPAPLGLAVERVEGELSQSGDDGAVEPAGHRGDSRSGRLVHERHELVGEAGHRAADADAADVGTAADAAHP